MTYYWSSNLHFVGVKNEHEFSIQFRIKTKTKRREHHERRLDKTITQRPTTLIRKPTETVVNSST